MTEKIKFKKLAWTDNVYAVVRCPDCGIEARIDKEQYGGKVSMICDCGWHETINFQELEEG